MPFNYKINSYIMLINVHFELFRYFLDANYILIWLNTCSLCIHICKLDDKQTSYMCTCMLIMYQLLHNSANIRHIFDNNGELLFLHL